MSSDKDDDDDYDDDDEIIKILMYSDEYSETTDQKEKNITMKKLIDYFDKMIGKSKSFEDQTESLEKRKNIDRYFINDFDDKESKSKIFKLKLSHLSDIIAKKLFAQIFGHTLETLANKLINTTNKKENQVIFKNININKAFTNKKEQRLMIG